MAKTPDTTWVLVGFKITFKHPAGRCRRLHQHLPCRGQSRRPRMSSSSPHHRISVKRVCTITTSIRIAHTSYSSTFFYLMSLLLAQVRPAKLYIHSLMLYDIHATRPSITYSDRWHSYIISEALLHTFSFSCSVLKVEVYSAVR